MNYTFFYLSELSAMANHVVYEINPHQVILVDPQNQFEIEPDVEFNRNMEIISNMIIPANAEFKNENIDDPYKKTKIDKEILINSLALLFNIIIQY